jgi:hypothetical protein
MPAAVPNAAAARLGTLYGLVAATLVSHAPAATGPAASMARAHPENRSPLVAISPANAPAAPSRAAVVPTTPPGGMASPSINGRVSGSTTPALRAWSTRVPAR